MGCSAGGSNLTFEPRMSAELRIKEPLPASAAFWIGIDLGTSHTVVAAAPRLDESLAVIEEVALPQLIRPGELESRVLLPSVRYHPAGFEIAGPDRTLPWESEAPEQGPSAPIYGALARALGSRYPGRLVVSAKSWLSAPGADRRGPILPPDAPEGAPRVSPLMASQSYLSYVRQAWNHLRPEAPLERQAVVLTVPASFDPVARQLTLEAAQAAGLPQVLLLEEPQAACYDWLWRWRQGESSPAKMPTLILVIDLGGGTLDLTLIARTGKDSAPEFNRIAVGPHLMLGGDNLDLALAGLAESVLSDQGQPLPRSERPALIEACRSLKEQLLGVAPPEQPSLTLLGQGTRLIGGARTVTLDRDLAMSTLVEGFFPEVPFSEEVHSRRGGLVELGLPYAADPRVTAHVADFLRAHQPAIREALGDSAGERGLPDGLLLNGGVLSSERLVKRLVDQLRQWGAETLQVLENPRPDTAVAHGAVAFALAREGRVIPRIGGGVARSLFLLLPEEGVEEASPKGCCLLPRGTPEGQSVPLTTRRFLLRLGGPVRMVLAEALDDERRQPGEVLTLSEGRFRSLPPMVLALEGEEVVEREVMLVAQLSEVGTLDIDCVATDPGAQRWRIAFDLRPKAPAPQSPSMSSDHPRQQEAITLILEVFGPKSKTVDPKAVKRLRSELERLLGARESWDLPLLRTLAQPLMDGLSFRRRSLDHERVWLNLTGYCLRPGFGHPDDQARLNRLFALFEGGPQFHQENQIWSEWWTLWRRVAGGFDARVQQRIYEVIRPGLDPQQLRSGAMAAQAKRRAPEDRLRLAAVLEWLPLDSKQDLLVWLFKRTERRSEEAQGLWWAIGRIAARKLWHGPVSAVIPPGVLTPWVERILDRPLKDCRELGLALTGMARCTGDPALDLAEGLRHRVAKALAAAKCPVSWQTLVTSVTEWSEADQRSVVGETLPPGLRLVGEAPQGLSARSSQGQESG